MSNLSSKKLICSFLALVILIIENQLTNVFSRATTDFLDNQKIQ